MARQNRNQMLSGSGKLLNSDNSVYDFTSGFRSLASAVASLPALLVSLLANGVALLVNGVSILTELGNILTQVSLGKIDPATGVEICTSFPHHKIHEGDMFHADINSTDLDDEGVNDALHISFVTPNTAKWGHLLYKLYVSGQATFEIVEAPTGGVVGASALPIYNHNRNSSTASVMKNTNDGTVNQATQDATAPTGGTVIHHEELGTGKNKQSGVGREDNEIILKQNTKYSFRLSSVTADITAQLTLDWYELENVG